MTIMMHRRAFLGSCTTAATAAVTIPSTTTWRIPQSANNILSSNPRDWVPPTAAITLCDPRVTALALRIIDAARSAGAHYADVRLTNVCWRGPGDTSGTIPNDGVNLGLSVRALVNGYWGWVATPMLSVDEGVRVARKAAEFATRAARNGRPRTVEFGTIPVVHKGDWRTPVKIDPFSVPLGEVQDVLAEFGQAFVEAGRVRSRAGEINSVNIGCGFSQEERLFASTEGSLATQTIVMMHPSMQNWTYRSVNAGSIPYFNQPVQTGWEWITARSAKDWATPAMDWIDMLLALRLPIKPFEIGRYDVVFDATSMAALTAATFGPATQLDRALGYEANAGGTSYLGPNPFACLGTPIASPLVTVTADRTTPTAAGTVKWDDEGVATEDFPLVTKGMLVDYQTTREQAAWLAPWYQKQGLPIRSHGCAGAPNALSSTMQHTPNLMLQPGTDAKGFMQLMAELDHGLIIHGVDPRMDFQCLTGHASVGEVLEVRQGKLVAILRGNAQILFRSTDLWKNVDAIGGPESLHWAISSYSRKGEPEQFAEFSVAAVPARIKQLAFIDPMKKA